MRVLVAGAAVTAGFVGCIDLFHSTDFVTCSDGDCVADAAPVRADVTVVKDAGKDGGHDTGRDSGRADATRADAGGGDGGAHEGGAHDAGHDVTVEDAKGHADVRDEGGIVDAGHDVRLLVDADFCAWEGGTARTNAAHACLWLGACAGTADLNDFGTCYPNALLAYDCVLNPNLPVAGELHTYWNTLWQAESCGDVIRAILPNGPTRCTNASARCGDDLEGGVGFDAVAVACSDAGSFASAVNCDMEGYTCVKGTCALGNSLACEGGTGAPPSCDGGVFHWCATEMSPDSSTDYIVTDVGRNCAHFGAGICIANGNVAGCGSVGDAGCSFAGLQSVCVNNAVVPLVSRGCLAPGRGAQISCIEFGSDASCDEAYNVPSSAPAGQCVASKRGAGPSVCAQGVVYEYAGPAGNLFAGCVDAGLNPCSAQGGRPACVPPP